jgi:hypothetical protein
MDRRQPLAQQCSSSLNKTRSLTSISTKNHDQDSYAQFDQRTADLHGRLNEANNKCEMLMKKLEQQQNAFVKATDPARSSEPISPILAPHEPLDALSKNGSNHFKQLDRMIRYMPSFNGKVDENYDSYVIGVRQTLEAYAIGCSEEEKLNAVRVKIGGDAREVLASSGTISSVEALLSTMHATYGRDQRTTISEVKQKLNETVRMFANRLRMNLKLLGWVGVDDPNKPNIVSLEFFINGLLPSISSDVRKLCPRNLDIAVDYAIQMESQKLAVVDSSKNCKLKINNIANDDAPSNDFANFNRSIKDQIAALSAQIKNSFNKPIDSNTNSNNFNRPSPYNRSNDNRRPYKGTCFGCKEIGHTYLSCKKISEEKKEEIRANYPTILAEYRAKRADSALNSNGVSTPSK